MKDELNGTKLKQAMLGRLVHYYHFLNEQFMADPESAVKSHQIAELVNMDDSLIRKDLASIGVRGEQSSTSRSGKDVPGLLGFWRRSVRAGRQTR